MAQTNYTPISLYYSTTASAVPTAANLVPGELAINTNDGKLYYEDSSGVVRVLASKSTGSIGGSTTQVQFNSSGSLAGSANFVFDGTNVGIGTSSPAFKTEIVGGATTTETTLFQIRSDGGGIGTGSTIAFANSTNTTAGSGRVEIAGIRDTSSGSSFVIRTADSGGTIQNRVKIDSSGNLLVGTTSGGNSTVVKSVTENAGEGVFTISSQTGFNVIVLGTTGTGYSVANTTMFVKKDTGTNRSINAAGTINASGADYAEYMTKARNFTIAKGDVVGINAQGKLTNVFSEAISFVVKSTNPSYVGGDSWGSEDVIGKRPDVDAPQSEKDSFKLALENARQTVDRIAFCGQVPVNVISATVGQYIIPFNDNGAIKGVAINEDDLTMSQYIKSVGKVIKVVDGKPTIIVKVA
jgi:hypothetical protein